ncbi:MAG TPA: hypothetical protein PKB13_01050 [Clostridia bacterium]|nr:hypothetical protein [Clostridia bacterium]
MKVITNGTEIQCARAVKGVDYIGLYDASRNLIASFGGITDFSGYIIVGGEWDVPQPTEKERIDALESAVLAVIMGGMNI